MGGCSGIALQAMLACGLTFPLLVLSGGWLLMRTRGASRGHETPDRPRAILNERLAAGEIEVEEYLERESALRDGEFVSPPRAGRRAH